LAGALGPLLEGMEDIDGLRELRDVQNPKCSASLDPDFPDPRPHGGHRFPMLGLEAQLDAVQLMAGGAPGVRWEVAEILEARAQPHECFIGHGPIYKMLYVRARAAYPALAAAGASDWTIDCASFTPAPPQKRGTLATVSQVKRVVGPSNGSDGASR